MNALKENRDSCALAPFVIKKIICEDVVQSLSRNGHMLFYFP